MSQGLADRFSAEFTAKAGGEVVYDEDRARRHDRLRGTSSSEITPLEPDLVFFGGEYEVAAALSKPRPLTSSAPIMGGDGIKDDAYIEAAGAERGGRHRPARWAARRTARVRRLRGCVRRAAGFAEPPTDYGPYAYDAANMLIEAAAAALEGQNQVTPEGSCGGRRRGAGRRRTGMTGRISFDEYGDTRTKVLTIYRVTDGAWSAVRTEQVG